MMPPIPSVARCTRLALAAVLMAAASTAGTVTAQVPATFTNLQVIPKDIGQRPLIDMMRGFVRALDVRCEFCHVGEGNDLSKFDFASDAKPAKVTARLMMKMLADVNRQLAAVGTEAATPKATCFTCHRGARLPLTAPTTGSGRGNLATVPIR